MPVSEFRRQTWVVWAWGEISRPENFVRLIVFYLFHYLSGYSVAVRVLFLLAGFFVPLADGCCEINGRGVSVLRSKCIANSASSGMAWRNISDRLRTLACAKTAHKEKCID